MKDLRTGAVERLDDEQAPGYDTGHQPAISADGRYVVFAASRSEGSSEHDQHARVYRVDRRTGTAVRVSQAPDPGRWRSVTNLSISADGTRVGLGRPGAGRHLGRPARVRPPPAVINRVLAS
ncbi:hypothetical protein AB0I27_27325 [Streptomyces sp. NPDC050597]|uniref:TolB family protein n=1 Tax=Streptomyces sp. NPDC050597 TaxID=3157212 RepID=UPI0034279E69